eukprot:TRINITY_DN880_c0_g1_i10.p1 TRINITY_DN880_c0_g1~~TRINITY_DN880_c0_g1_i10.p1  ORF type:complete len:530 (-),score=61.71 TRINITY_DN880_c0_g1_i10:871-2460(-)
MEILKAVVVLCLLVGTSQALTSDQWVNHGGGIKNWRYAKQERRISPDTVKNLKLRWEFVAGGDISATPAIYKGVVYFPSWNGNLYAVHQENGSLLWSKNLTQLTGFPRISNGLALLSRATPVVDKHLLFVGVKGPANVLALNRFTGDLIWSTKLDNHPAAIITQSGTIYEEYYYVGVSSAEEAIATVPCCFFIGSFQKLDIQTGKVVWRTNTLPDNGGKPGGYSGAAIWGSSPSIDVKRKLVYLATGNVYSVPPEIDACAARQQNLTKPQVPDPCLEAVNLGNAILALELDTGKIRWGKVFGGYDAFTLACLVPNIRNLPNCPAGPALDYDFGEAPMLLTIPHPVENLGYLDIAVAAQKSGIVWAVNRDTGEVVWDAVAGPGGFIGGSNWGSATDGELIYINIINNGGGNFTLAPSSEVTHGGGWVAVRAATGKVEWSVAAPNQTHSYAPVTVANGVVFVAAGTPGGDVYALDARRGDVLWHSSVPVGLTYGGFSISGGCAFVGSGYGVSNVARNIGGTNGTSMYAFCV